MESQGGQPIAEPTLTVGTVSKALTAVVQVTRTERRVVGEPIFDREGKVIAMLYAVSASRREDHLRVPAYIVADYLKSLNLAR